MPRTLMRKGGRTAEMQGCDTPELFRGSLGVFGFRVVFAEFNPET